MTSIEDAIEQLDAVNDLPKVPPFLFLLVGPAHASTSVRISFFRSRAVLSGRSTAFEKFQGTPLFLIKLLTMQRIATDPGGTITELARDAIGLGTQDEITARVAAERQELFVSAAPVQVPALVPTNGSNAATQGFSMDGKDQPDYVKSQDA